MVYTIVVTYNGENDIRKCLSSLITSSITTEIIVIDNNSSDNTSNIILSEFTNIQFIPLKENVGFAKANNIGIAKAFEQKIGYVFLLNQDAWVEFDTIEKLVHISEKNPAYGIISPMHLNGSYTDLDIKFANYLVPQECKGFLSDLFLNKLNDIYELQFVNAAAWLIPVNTIHKTGFFDPIFFFYGEDNNYLQRVKYHGSKVGIASNCTICHNREIRKGALNRIHERKWERTQSLIILLNIQKSFKECTLSFFYKKVYEIIRLMMNGKFSYLRYTFSELFYFFTHIGKLKFIRDNYKHVNNNWIA